MPAVSPLSLKGAWAALRWPTGPDVLLSVKGALAVTLALAIGFGANLENPYWAALTIYVLLSQPQTGAIRNKSLYRFGGTLLGGSAAMLFAALFGSHVGAFLIANLLFVLATMYLKLLDRTPANYLWFATALTDAVIGIVHVSEPATIFTYATARMLEISLGVLCIFLVDSILEPRTQTPAFLKAMTAMRDEAADWAAAALSPDASDALPDRWARRRSLRKIFERTAILDMQGVQLPFDVGPNPPRAADLRLLRLTLARLVGQLSMANLWIESARAHHDPESTPLAETRAWLAARPPIDSADILAHAAEGEALQSRLAAAGATLTAPGTTQDDVLHGTALTHLHRLVQNWAVQDRLLHALSTGARLPPALRTQARRARPIRSTDFLTPALDLLPLALTFLICTLLWYWGAWSGAIGAMLFGYVVSAFIVGLPGVVGAGAGAVVWVGCAFALTFLYQFAILPRVTTFPTLIAVLSLATLPLGIFMAMSPAGLLTLANAFAFLGLQGTYAGNFLSTLQSFGASMTGAAMIVALIYVCGYDVPRLRTRRIPRLMALDVAVAASARRLPDLDRYITLSVDRLSLYYAAAAALPPDDATTYQNLVARFRIGAFVLRLRAAEPGLPPEARAACRTLRRTIATQYRTGHAPDEPTLLAAADQACATLLATPAAGPPRTEALTALTGLRIAAARDPELATYARSHPNDP